MSKVEKQPAPSGESGMLPMILGGAAGYLYGKSQAPVASQAVPLDYAGLQSQVSTLSQQNDLLKSQVATIGALRDLAISNGAAATAAKDALNTQLLSLQSQVATVQQSVFQGFPLVLGKGDPSLGGWVKGRDKLLISRVLPNITPQGVIIATSVQQASPASQPTKSPLSVADITQSLPGRAVQIGKNPNTSLEILMPKGIDLNVAVILSFDEDIADDTDFMASAAIGGLLNCYAMATPVGRNALLIMPLAPAHAYSTWPYQYCFNTMRRGFPDDTVPAPSAKWSASASYYSQLRLSHRSARALTLRSYNVVANPLLVENETQFYDMTTLTGTRNVGECVNVLRMNTGVTPKFLRVNDQYQIVNADVSPASYA